MKPTITSSVRHKGRRPNVENILDKKKKDKTELMLCLELELNLRCMSDV